MRIHCGIFFRGRHNKGGKRFSDKIIRMQGDGRSLMWILASESGCAVLGSGRSTKIVSTVRMTHERLWEMKSGTHAELS